MTPFREIRSPVLAWLGAIITAASVTAVALTLLFIIAPPTVRTLSGDPVLVDLKLFVSELFRVGDTYCGRGWWILTLDCRFDVAWHLLGHSIFTPVLVPRAIIIALAVGMGATVAAGWIWDRTPRSDGLTHIRGRRLVQDSAARNSLRRHLAGIGRPAESGLWLAPHVQLPSAAESYNILAIGTQGAGKSGLIRAWAEQFLARGDRVLIHDVKGDVTSGLPVDRFILVAPHDARSAAWDIASDVRDRAAALEFAARSIKAATGDTMWADGARALWADAVLVLIRRQGTNWTLDDLYALLTSSPAVFRDALVEIGAASAELIAFDEAGGVQRTSMSLLITLWVATFTVLRPLVDAWAEVPPRRRFSLSCWLDEDGLLPKTIVIQKSSTYPDLSALVGGLLVERLAGLVLAPGRPRNSSHRIALVLDELAELGRLKQLPNLLAVGREVGVMTIAAVQDLGQLVETYGEVQARNLEARFGIKVVGRLTAGDTAERISKILIGDRLVEYEEPQGQARNSSSISPATRRETHPVFAPERFEAELGVRTAKRTALIRTLVLGLGDAALLDVPFTTWPNRRSGSRPASWIRAATAIQPSEPEIRQPEKWANCRTAQ